MIHCMVVRRCQEKTYVFFPAKQRVFFAETCNNLPSKPPEMISIPVEDLVALCHRFVFEANGHKSLPPGDVGQKVIK